MDISELCLEAFPTHFSWLMTVSWNADVMRVEHIYCSKHLVLQQQHQQQISISVSNIRLDNKEVDWFPLVVELLKRSLTGKCNSPVWSVGTVVRFQVYKYLTVVVLYIYAINTIYRVKTCTVCRIQSSNHWRTQLSVFLVWLFLYCMFSLSYVLCVILWIMLQFQWITHYETSQF